MTKQTLSVGVKPEVQIERVGGDLAVAGWDRVDLEAQGEGLQITRDGNSIRISGANMHLSVPRCASLTVSFVGGNVNVENMDGAMELSFVGGDAILRNLAGQVSLRGLVGGDTRLENVSNMSIEAHKRRTTSYGPERLRRKIDQAPQRADEKLKHAEIKMENAASKTRHRAQVRVNPGVGRSKWTASPGPFKTAAASQPVSDEERVAILKMLQEKKITAEQAETLLTALEDTA